MFDKIITHNLAHELSQSSFISNSICICFFLILILSLILVYLVLILITSCLLNQI